jgi:hypothetical protein
MKRKIFLITCLIIQVSFAQTTSDKASKLGDSVQKAPRMSSEKPNPDIHKVIRKLKGTWNVVQYFELSEDLPKGGVGKGVEIWRPGPGELSVIEEANGKGPFGEGSVIAVSWWDEEAKVFPSLVCPNSSRCQVDTDVTIWEHDTLVFRGNYERNGKHMIYKEAWFDFTQESFKQIMYAGEVGQALKVRFKIYGTRAKGSKRTKE